MKKILVLLVIVCFTLPAFAVDPIKHKTCNTCFEMGIPGWAFLKVQTVSIFDLLRATEKAFGEAKEILVKKGYFPTSENCDSCSDTSSDNLVFSLQGKVEDPTKQYCWVNNIATATIMDGTQKVFSTSELETSCAIGTICSASSIQACQVEEYTEALNTVITALDDVPSCEKI